MKSSSALLWLSAAILMLIVFNRFKWEENNSMQWDASGYYLYLPAAFIHQDLDSYAFYPAMNAAYGLAPGATYFALHPQAATGRLLNKYPIGVALMEAPFFIAGHLLTKLFTAYPADGFSAPYRLGICICTVFWCLAGLWLLRAMLRRYFEEPIVAGVLALLLFATNLYNYTAFDAGMSHPVSFFLFAAALFLADQHAASGSGRNLILLGLVCGMIVIVRPVNALLLPLLVFWQPGNAVLENPLRRLARSPAAACGAVIVFAAVLLLQCAYWKYTTGDWIHYSYEGEGFDFTRPRIVKGLFSYRKGWMVYTPLALAAFLGIVVMFVRRRWLAWAISLYFALAIFIAFSWHQWYYGGSFGCRVLIESFAVYALPLAYLLQWLLKQRVSIRIIGSGILVLCLALNVWQTYQFNIAMIPTDGNTKEWYWRAFFKLEKTPEDEILFRKIDR